MNYALRSTAPTRPAFLIAICIAASLAAIAQDNASKGPAVQILGGATPEGNFEYEIRNQSGKRITEVSFPHFKADLFTVPSGWQQDMSNPARLGGSKPGIARAWVEGQSQGIRSGSSAKFALRTPAQTDIPRRRGVVTVRFDDGTTLPVAGVELPSAPSSTEQYQMLIGLGLIFAIIVAARGLRSRKPIGEPLGAADDAPGDDDPRNQG